MIYVKYSEEEIKAFVELASEVGINRARRELKYPSAWIVGKKWCDNAGVVIALDELKQRASQHNQFYQDSELLLALQDSIDRAIELMKDPALSPGDLEKLTNTIKKSSDMIRTIQGKSTKESAAIDSSIAQLVKEMEQTK